MITLFFSLITDFIFISLFKNEKLFKSIYESNHCLHSENFINKLSFLLNDQNISLKDVDNIFFISGPGGQTGERVSFSFVTSMKILNPELKVFSLDSLTFQSGLIPNCLSIISVGQNTKKYYLNVYHDRNLILKKERIEKFEVDKIIEEFRDFSLVCNFKDVDFSKIFLLLKDNFSEFNEID
jgi:tRNA A37 threonylcarbamoyladenosine modification protein TsaB